MLSCACFRLHCLIYKVHRAAPWQSCSEIRSFFVSPSHCYRHAARTLILSFCASCCQYFCDKYIEKISKKYQNNEKRKVSISMTPMLSQHDLRRVPGADRGFFNDHREYAFPRHHAVAGLLAYHAVVMTLFTYLSYLQQRIPDA